MEEEKTISIVRNSYKRKLRSYSEDPNDSYLCFQRSKSSIADTISCDKFSPSTIYFHRPFLSYIDPSIVIRPPKNFEMQNQKYLLMPMSPGQFLVDYETIMSAIELITAEGIKEKKKKQKVNVKEEKLSIVEAYFKKKFFNYKMIAQESGLKHQEIRCLHIKYNERGTIFHDYRPKIPKLSDIHIDFIKKYFSIPQNFDKTLIDLHLALTIEFKLKEKYITVRSLCRYMHKIAFTHKKIIYKINNANTPEVKEKRKKAAILILTAHINNFEFLYIDEISFNIEMRPYFGWSLIGKSIETSKPPKSKNYSAILQVSL